MEEIVTECLEVRLKKLLDRVEDSMSFHGNKIAETTKLMVSHTLASNFGAIRESVSEIIAEKFSTCFPPLMASLHDKMAEVCRTSIAEALPSTLAASQVDASTASAEHTERDSRNSLLRDSSLSDNIDEHSNTRKRLRESPTSAGDDSTDSVFMFRPEPSATYTKNNSSSHKIDTSHHCDAEDVSLADDFDFIPQPKRRRVARKNPKRKARPMESMKD